MSALVGMTSPLTLYFLWHGDRGVINSALKSCSQDWLTDAGCQQHTMGQPIHSPTTGGWIHQSPRETFC